jgi:hypothetical protein
MSMTHYMELLATNQPWNLILFMAIPIVLAETVVVTELYLLYTRNLDGFVRQINRWAGILVGFYFVPASLYVLITAALPLSFRGGWRGWIDQTAVWCYLAGVIPLLGIALLEVGALFKSAMPEKKLMIHACFVALFLVLGHVAMVFGMLDPALAGRPVAPASSIPESAPAAHPHAVAEPPATVPQAPPVAVPTAPDAPSAAPPADAPSAGHGHGG